MKLVGADCQQVDMHTFRINPALPKSLNSVHMKQGAGIHALDQLSCLLNRLNSTYLVIRMHN